MFRARVPRTHAEGEDSADPARLCSIVVVGSTSRTEGRDPLEYATRFAVR